MMGGCEKVMMGGWEKVMMGGRWGGSRTHCARCLTLPRHVE